MGAHHLPGMPAPKGADLSGLIHPPAHPPTGDLTYMSFHGNFHEGKPLTTHQVLALLRVAEQDLMGDLPITEHGAFLPCPAYEIWMELGRCFGDLAGATNPKTSPSARTALIKAGFIQENKGPHKRGLRFSLTVKGAAWCEELAAAGILIRAMRRLPFDFD